MLIKKAEQKLSEQLSDKQAQTIIVQLVKKTREHPEIGRGGSIRASLAVMEIARGYRCIRGKLTRNILKDAAMLALPARITLRPESKKTPEYIVFEIVQEVVFGIQSLEYGDPFKKKQTANRKKSGCRIYQRADEFSGTTVQGKNKVEKYSCRICKSKRK